MDPVNVTRNAGPPPLDSRVRGNKRKVGNAIGMRAN